MNKHNFILVFSVVLAVAISMLLHYYWVLMEWKDIVMTDAVVIGPIVAVVITRMLDDERFTKNRKLEIFRALVKDRSNPTSIDFVNAFNLIHVEFADNGGVIRAWYALSESRNSPVPPKDDADGWQRKMQEWNKKTDRLLYEIAEIINIKIDPFEIQASYIPVAWGNELQENKQIKKLLLELLNNERSLRVSAEDNALQSPVNKKL